MNDILFITSPFWIVGIFLGLRLLFAGTLIAETWNIANGFTDE